MGVHISLVSRSTTTLMVLLSGSDYRVPPSPCPLKCCQQAWLVTSLHCDPPTGLALFLPNQPASQAPALFWDANIHTLLEPQIKGSIPPPASQWPLCAREFEHGEREGLGRGAQHKDTCHPAKSAGHDVKRDARWRTEPATVGFSFQSVVVR